MITFGGEKLTFGARGANKHLVRGSLLGGIFPYGRMSKFLASRRDSPHPPVGKTLRIGAGGWGGGFSKKKIKKRGVCKTGKAFIKQEGSASLQQLYTFL